MKLLKQIKGKKHAKIVETEAKITKVKAQVNIYL